MAGPFVWWANRKSRLGLSPNAREPAPKLPGRPWWTDPPVSAPVPEHIEYVQRFTTEVMGQRGSAQRDLLLRHLSQWMKAAQRLLHENAHSATMADLNTTDGLWVAVSSAMHKMRSRIYGLGGVVDDDITEVMRIVQSRAEKIRRERALHRHAPPIDAARGQEDGS
jgi:hypothetical protein